MSKGILATKYDVQVDIDDRLDICEEYEAFGILAFHINGGNQNLQYFPKWNTILWQKEVGALDAQLTQHYRSRMMVIESSVDLAGACLQIEALINTKRIGSCSIECRKRATKGFWKHSRDGLLP